jgi:hypothetical protein
MNSGHAHAEPAGRREMAELVPGDREQQTEREEHDPDDEHHEAKR